jgi:hypothetical protein
MPDYLIPVVYSALLLAAPILFLVVVWIIMRLAKKKGISLAGRFFLLAGFSAATVGFALLLNRFSPYLQFSTESMLIGSLSYALGLGWMVVPLMALITMAVATSAGVATLLLHRKKKG